MPENVVVPLPGAELTVSPWPYRAPGQQTRGFWVVKQVPGVGIVLHFTSSGRPDGWTLTACTPAAEANAGDSPEAGERILEALPALKQKRFRTRRDALEALGVSLDRRSKLEEVLGGML